MSLSKLWVMVNDREARLQSMELQRVECDWVTEQQQGMKSERDKQAEQKGFWQQ